MAPPNNRKNGRPIGVLVISHGDLGEHFIEAARIICQDGLDGLESLSIQASYERDKVREQLALSMERLEGSADEIIALCDTYGSTPSRILCAGSYKARVKCVFGLNLPMLLDCISLRGELDLDGLAEQICQAGAEAIFARETDDAAAHLKASEA